MKTRNYKPFYRLLNEHSRISGLEANELKEQFVHSMSNGRTTSVKELTDVEYAALLGAMEAKLGADRDADGDRWRKRVMAAIGAWLRAAAAEETPAKIKAIACRAAQCKDFNAIPISKLRGIYSEFTKQKKAAERGRAIVAEILASDA
jgi:hypothetical protein